MSSVVIAGDTSGSVTLAAPSVAGSTTLTLPATSGNVLTSTSATVGSSGITFNDGSTQTAAASPYVLKNRIINGAMQIWQRGTSFTVAGGSVTYTADRFGSFTNNTNMTISRNTSVPTTAGSLFPYSLQLQRPASSTQTNGLYLTQVIESVNCYDLAGQTVTVSFWAKAGANFSASGNSLNIATITGTVADQSTLSMLSGTWTGQAFTGYYPSITTTWTKYTYTSAIPSNALEIGLQFYFNPTGTAGADDSLYITGVQLEVGSTATPFERRLYNQELANCQRYYQGAQSFYGLKTPNGYTRINIGLPVAMRTTPGITFTDNVGNASRISTYSATDVITNNRIVVAFTGQSPVLINLLPNNTDSDPGYLVNVTMSAEL